MSKRYFILIFIFFLGLSLESSAQKLYWSDYGSGNINVSDLGVGSISNTTSLVNTAMLSFCIDRGNNYIYYCNQEDIFRADLATGDDEIQVMDNGAMAGYDEIAYSSAEDVLYAAGMGGMYGAMKIDIHNGTDESLNVSGKGGDVIVGVAAYDGNEVIYFADKTDYAIYGTGLDGETVIESISIGTEDLEYLAIDEFTGVLYYSTTFSNTHKLRSYNINNGVTTEIASMTSAVAGRILSIAPYSQFGKVYYVREGLGVYCKNIDGSGTETQVISNGGINEIAILPDVTPPTFNALLPVDAATGVDRDQNLVLTFSEPISLSALSGVANETSFRIFQNGNATPIETIDRASSKVSISGATVTINPATTLLYGTDYYVLAGTKIIRDASGNHWVGIASPTGWNFTTEADETKFYSRQSGNWNDINTWSHVSHAGPVATSIPNSQNDIFIGNGHTVTLTGPTTYMANSSGLTIESGGTLDANGQTLQIAGAFTIVGDFINPGEVQSYYCAAQINNTSGKRLVFDRLVVNHGCGSGIVTLNTDLVVLNGVQIVVGTLDNNGFNICDASVSPPVNPVFTNNKSNSVTLSWQTGAADAFVVARAGSTNFEPSIGSQYNANAVFGSGNAVGAGNFVVYKGTGTSVDITGLLPATDYEFDLYSYRNIVGGCYTVTNYQFVQHTTCPNLSAPANPVPASYCTGSATVAVKVDAPGTGKRIDWYAGATGTPTAAGVASGTGRESFLPTAAGTFYAEVVDIASGCTSTTRTPVTLTMNTLPTTVNQTPAVCEATPGSGTAANINLTTFNAAVAANAAGTSVSWFTNSGLTTAVASPTSASINNGGTFHAKVTNTTTQCYKSATATFTVNPLPSTTLTGLLTPCANAKNVSYQATSGATTFTWTVPNGATVVSGQGTNSIAVDFGSDGGTISVVPSNGATCQGAADKKTITLSTAPALFTVRGGGIYCAGGNGVAVSLSGSTSGVRYEIFRGANLANTVTSTGGTINFPPITQAGVYTVKAISPANCTSDMTGSATVTQGTSPSGTGVITGSTKNCTGKESTYTVSGIAAAVDYQWTLPNGVTMVSQSSNTITVRASGGNGGEISVVGNNECGPGGFALLQVEVSTPPSVSIELPKEPVIVGEPAEFNFSSAGTDVSNTEWVFGDDGTSSETHPSHSYSSPGNYTVTLNVSDALGCISTDNKTLAVIAEPGLSDNSIKNAITMNDDQKNDVLYIDRIDKFPDNEVILLDRWGVEVYRTKGYNNDWDMKKNGEYLPPGNYVCIVKLNESGKVFKRTVTLIK